MKRFLIVVAALLLVAVLVPVLMNVFGEKQPVDGGDCYIVPAVMVDGQVYSYWAYKQDAEEPLLTVDDAAIDGYITSKLTPVDFTGWPTENNQTNYTPANGAPYVLVDGLLLVKYDDVWHIFRPKS